MLMGAELSVLISLSLNFLAWLLPSPTASEVVASARRCSHSPLQQLRSQIRRRKNSTLNVSLARAKSALLPRVGCYHDGVTRLTPFSFLTRLTPFMQWLGFCRPCRC